jgi:hypothetical protein
MYNVEIILPKDLTKAIDLLNNMNAWCSTHMDDKTLPLYNFVNINENDVLYRFEDQGMAVLFSLKWVK